jgi:hypothetical protein
MRTMIGGEGGAPPVETAPSNSKPAAAMPNLIEKCSRAHQASIATKQIADRKFCASLSCLMGIFLRVPLRCRGFATDLPAVGVNRLRFAIPAGRGFRYRRAGIELQREPLRAATRMRCARSAPLSSCWIQIPSSGAGQNDIGRDHDPKCVVADEGDLDEHPHDRKAHHYERERKSKLHDTSPMRRNKSNKRFRDSRCKTRLHLRFAFARASRCGGRTIVPASISSEAEPCQRSNRQSVSGMAQHGST